MKLWTPNKEVPNWNFGEIRFYGILMGLLGFGIGFCIKGLYF